MCNCTEVKTTWIELKSFIFRKIKVILDIEPRMYSIWLPQARLKLYSYKYYISGNKNIYFLDSSRKSAPPVNHSSQKIQIVYTEKELEVLI